LKPFNLRPLWLLLAAEHRLEAERIESLLYTVTQSSDFREGSLWIAAPLNEVTDVLGAIGSVETLEETVAAIRRQ
jgi:hypothetical protein